MDSVSLGKHLLSWFVLIIITLRIVCCRGCLDVERMALLELKAFFNSVSDYSDHVLDSWPDDDTRSDCCEWDRVKCDDASRRVVGLALNHCIQSTGHPLMNLSLLHPFEELRRLYLNNNNFIGWFDDIEGSKSFARLKRLEILNLGNNMFDGSVFTFLGAATSLKKLSLSGNILNGVFPPKGLADMINLRILDLSSNNFSLLSAKGYSDAMKLKALDLSDNKFYGYLQMQGICKLKNLRELDLSNNKFRGHLPHCLRNLMRLRVLDVTSCQLSGNPKSVVTSLTSLEYLSLYDNNFKGVFSFSSFYNHSKLKVFRLSSKPGMIQVEGESSRLPNFQLQALQLRNCSLRKIPSFLLSQSNLRFVDLSHNNLVGKVPAWLIQNNSKLEALYLMNNSFTDLQTPKDTHGLLHLDVSANKITGLIPENLHIILPKLQCLNFSYNAFHGGIPSTTGEMKCLEILDLSFNNLSGQLPRNFVAGSCPLKFLKLSGSNLQGQIFPEYANLTQLMWLHIDNNNFTGSLGKGLLNSIALIALDISNNMLSGRIPDWIGSLSMLEFLLMGQNHFEGDIPVQIQSLDLLQILDLSENNLSGSIPLTFNFSNLRHLHLQNNGLLGSLPDTLFDSGALVTLDLRNNKISGNIPKQVGKLSHLSVLLLRGNLIFGHIPNETCQLRELNFLDLSSNRFGGSIPSCINNMSFGMSGDGTSNLNIQNVFKYEDAKLKTYYQYASTLVLPLVYADYEVFSTRVIVEFETKRRYESFEGGILPYMFGLDLSSNELTSEIPTEIGDLQKLRALNLSYNHFSGLILESFSNLKNIESLDLSHNRLQGHIPPQLAELYALAVFDVSYNNLSGPIPYKGQFATFDESHYVGNPGLCGPPTNKSCRDTEASITSFVEGRDDGWDTDMEAFYWSFGVTYVVVLLGIFVFLCIDSKWSRAWFDLVLDCICHLHRFKRAMCLRNVCCKN